MRNDQIFVLLLVILLPMSGCFDGAVGDAEGTDDEEASTTIVNNYYNYSANQQPLIYGSFSGCSSECYYQGEWYDSYVSVSNIFTVDPDGNISDFGIDWNNDFEIDWSFPWDWNNSHREIFNEFDYSVVTINPPADPNDSDDHCYTGYFNLISEDNLGLKEIIPMKWQFDWDQEEERCEVGPRNND